MIIKLDKKAAQNLIKLKATSLLKDKEISSLFNIRLYRLAKLKKEFAASLKLSDKDWIYGALRTLGRCSIDDISEYIDYRNKIRLSENTIKNSLERLINEGFAYKAKDKWNYCQRSVEVYSIKTDKFIGEIEFGSFDLKVFKKQFQTQAWDYLLYEQFDISEKDQSILEGRISIDLDFKLYSYQLTCSQGEN